METFDKKKAFGIGGILTVVVTIIAVVANISEIVQLFRGDDKPESSVVETVDKNTEESVIEPAESNYNIEEVIESVEIIEQEEITTVSEPSVVYLNSLKVAESQGFYEDENSAEDTVGNTYIENVMVIGNGYDDECYATYYLGGKYKTLSGIISVHDRSADNYSGQVFISTDDNVIYTTEEVGRVSVPMEFSINVENCQWLKINKVGEAFNGSGTRFILSDWKLE